ncbi:MAG: hypothetical protein NC926_06260 [Candidatus Omnitrophica bacterium]|nr:hypothetical protein [Candidatus Omnitrophota bacterium]
MDRIENLLIDPLREEILKKERFTFEDIFNKFPHLKGEPAFDPKLIESNIERLKTNPEIDTGVPYLDKAIKIGLAHIDATFQGDHPKYGIKRYAETRHDGFPPIIISTIDALTLWGLNERAKKLFYYWVKNFIDRDGTIKYYAPSISEYGQIIYTAYLLIKRGGTDGWFKDCLFDLNRLINYILSLLEIAQKDSGLISGIPEADEGERKEQGKYFHNNGWVFKGLFYWIEISKELILYPEKFISYIKERIIKLKKDTLDAIKKIWPKDNSDYWLPPKIEKCEKPSYLTETFISSYTNYRYYGELLSSEILPKDLANKVIESRLNFGGQFCGMTRFLDRLDDWPLTDYLYGLWKLGRKNDFLISLFGHISYHQAEGHLTAYEQVSFPPGKEVAPYCLPCQLVATRAGRLINRR